jgi:hypothetical protein
MRIALFYLALVGLVAAFWAAFWPLDRPAPAAVPLAALYAVETELSEQAGAGDADRKLLDAMQAAAKSPADRAEVLRRSCGLHANVAGPQAAIAICAQAIVVARTADPATHHRTGRRLAKVLAGAGDAAGALALLDSLPRAQEGLESVLTGWVRAEALRGLKRAPEALENVQRASVELQAAVRVNPTLREYTAIADYELGRTLALTDPSADRTTARTALNRALVLQRQLDAQNPEYAEYRLFLTKIFRELSRLPGGDAMAREDAAHQADELASELSRRDPTRWEYQGL